MGRKAAPNGVGLHTTYTTFARNLCLSAHKEKTIENQVQGLEQHSTGSQARDMTFVSINFEILKLSTTLTIIFAYY